MATRSRSPSPVARACTALSKAKEFGGRAFLSLTSATTRAWCGSCSGSTRTTFRGSLGVCRASSSPFVLHPGAASCSWEPV
eukprot:2116808-Alexandrium_andersonii.AAC.1